MCKYIFVFHECSSRLVYFFRQRIRPGHGSAKGGLGWAGLGWAGLGEGGGGGIKQTFKLIKQQQRSDWLWTIKDIKADCIHNTCTLNWTGARRYHPWLEMWICVVWSVSALVSEEWLSNVIQAAAWLGCILFLNANAMYKQGFTSL